MLSSARAIAASRRLRAAATATKLVGFVLHPSTSGRRPRPRLPASALRSSGKLTQEESLLHAPDEQHKTKTKKSEPQSDLSKQRQAQDQDRPKKRAKHRQGAAKTARAKKKNPKLRAFQGPKGQRAKQKETRWCTKLSQRVFMPHQSFAF